MITVFYSMHMQCIGLEVLALKVEYVTRSLEEERTRQPFKVPVRPSNPKYRDLIECFSTALPAWPTRTRWREDFWSRPKLLGWRPSLVGWRSNKASLADGLLLHTPHSELVHVLGMILSANSSNKLYIEGIP